MSLKFYNVKTHDENQVWRRLNRSGKFGWSWCKDTHQPLRHVAIVLYFDGTPIYTINFRTVDGASLVAAAFSEAEPLITIEDAPKEGYIFFSPLEEFEVMTPAGNQRAKDRIKAIISYDPGHYNLFMNNCRDHVTGVLQTLLGTKLSDSDFENSMTDIRNEDTIWKTGATALSVFGVGLFAAGIFRAFTKSEEKEEIRE